MADRTVLVLDLGFLGRDLDAEKMQAAIGKEVPFRWDDREVPSRITAVTVKDDRMKVTVEIDAAMDWLDQGRPVSSGS